MSGRGAPGGIRRPRSVAAALALALALALAASPARAAGAEDSFREGMSALDQNKWGVAVAAFRAALAERPAEGGRRVRVYGTWLLDYLPRYYLGVALFQLGDLEGAAAEWRESRRQGAILATPLVTDLERWEARLPAELRAARREEAADPSRPPVPAVGAAAREAAPAAPVALATPGADAGAVPKRDAAAAGAPPSPVAPAGEPAPAGSEAATPARAPAAPPPASGGIEERELLLAAARLYFDGRYRETLAELAAARWPGRVPARACVLEAASAFALYRQAGASDARYLERARGALAACPALSALDRPDPRLFSPAFTRLFEEALAAR